MGKIVDKLGNCENVLMTYDRLKLTSYENVNYRILILFDSFSEFFYFAICYNIAWIITVYISDQSR